MDAPLASLSPTRAFLNEVELALDELDEGVIELLTDVLFEAWRREARVFVMGNGGSAAIASHLTCDLQAATRGPHTLSALCLTDSVPVVTALANDHGYENVFRDQLGAHARAGDVALFISASGNSENILRALELGQSRALTAIGMFGFGGGHAAALVRACVVVASHDFGVVESVHATVAHLLTSRLRARVAG